MIQLRRRRVLVGLVGFLVGVAVGVPLNYVFYGRYIDFTTFASGLAGAAIALFLAERKKNLPTAEEARGLRFGLTAPIITIMVVDLAAVVWHAKKRMEKGTF
jgi:hypothetical protein